MTTDTPKKLAPEAAPAMVARNSSASANAATQAIVTLLVSGRCRLIGPARLLVATVNPVTRGGVGKALFSGNPRAP
jgi:hypothetical protein